ncbi:MAG: hypothetical protein L3K26_16545 [Candidatus Hydrogenedentes bacterium]|nr:hypothetical protein [Candidatus Hydrogenedentota bacterium]
MAATLSPIIYGEKKNIDFSKFNIGNVLKAITYDLKEFGERGVQGVPVKSSDALKLVKYHSASKKVTEPYVMAGIVKKDLVLVIRDKKDTKLDAMSVLVKNYVGLKAKLAKSNAAVVNMDRGDDTIDDSSDAKASKLKTRVQEEDDTDFGGITGNVLLCAHGTPKTKPGRVIGTHLAGKKPSQICDVLTKNKDKKKRLAKSFAGKLTLSGCFTASGGPEKDKQDDPFAKKVWDEMKKRGYKKISVEGMPGPSWTANDNSDTDEYGKRMKRGDEGVYAKCQEMLEAQEKMAVKLRKDIDKITDKILKTHKSYKGDKSTFMANPKVQTELKKIQGLEKQLASVKAEVKKIEKDMAKTGDVDGKGMKALTGTFGLRVLKPVLKG